MYDTELGTQHCTTVLRKERERERERDWRDRDKERDWRERKRGGGGGGGGFEHQLTHSAPIVHPGS